MSLQKWWLRTPDEQEPTPGALREAFEGLPLDPRSGLPVGYLSFALELDARIAARRRAVEAVARPAPQLSGRNSRFLAELRAQAAASLRRAR